MAEIRRIVRSNPKSSFRQVGAVGGGAFAALADIANTAYEFMLPAAENQLKTEGAEAGREMARMQMGNNRVPFAYPGGGVWSEGYSKALSEAGFDQDYIRAAQAVIGGESAGEFSAQEDHRYSPARAREIFPDVFGGMDDDQISALVGAGPQDFFEATYGAGTRRGQNLGNTQPGDGGTFRGRGPIQLTGRANYERYGAMTGYDLVGNPDLITSDPQVAAAVTAAYLQDRVKMTGDPVADVRGAVAGSRTGAGFTMNIDADRARFQNGSPAPAASAPVPTMVKTAEGNVEPRLYSPMSGPLLQVYNAAAGTAYMSQISLSAAQDFTALHSQYLLNPEGFLDAARGYVDQVVEQAPDPFKADLRATLEEDMQQNYLGIVEDKQRDIRQRADNSSKALVDRRQKELAEAIAGGNPDTIASAESRLNGLLRARESLPGVAWTRAQSDNVILDAYDSAARIENTRVKELTKELGDSLDTAISAVDNGLHAADEGLLSDPNVWQLQPEKARELASKITLRENMPGFTSATPAQRDEVIQSWQENPVTSTGEIDIYKAMVDMDRKATAALEKDPVQYFQDFMPQGEKPPEIPADPTDAGFMSALAERSQYAAERAAEGYTDAPVIFSSEEATAFSAVLGKESPAAVRAVAASAIARGLGENARYALDQLDVDPVTRYGAKMIAAGGSETLLAEAISGQERINENLVQLPADKTSLKAVSPDIASAMSDLPLPAAAQREMLDFATALYAANDQAQGLNPTSNDAKDLLEASVNRALGQTTNARGNLVGGVQKIAGHPVFMPLEMSGDRLDAAIKSTFQGGAPEGLIDSLVSGLTFTGEVPNRAVNAEIWERASDYGDGGSVPMWGGSPLDPRMYLDKKIRLVAAGRRDGRAQYRMEVDIIGAPPTDVVNEDGTFFYFDPQALIEATR